MQNARENNKKNVKFRNNIQLPFDGTAKCCDEIARMVSKALLKRSVEKVDIIFPAQWAMKPAHILHPAGGVIACLHKDMEINRAYKFSCFARNGEIGVTATRSC